MVLVLGLAAFVSFGLHELVSVDLGYHLAYGQWMTRQGEVISQNQFSFTWPGWPFVNANWLFQLGLYGSYALGHAVGLSVLLLLLIAALGLSLALYMRLRGMGPLLTGLTLAAVALTSYERFVLRPELVTYICLVWTLILLQVRDRRPVGAWVGLAVLQVVWTNCHSYFLLGPALLGAHLCWRVLHVAAARAARRSAGDAGRDLRWLAVATVVMLACCLVNPRFVAGALMPLKTLGYLYQTDSLAARPGQSQTGPWGVISEFGWPLARGKIPFVMQGFYRASLALGVAAAVGQVLRRRMLDLPTLVLLLPASLAMRRNIPLWALVAWPAIAEGLAWSSARMAGRVPPVLRRLATPVAVPAVAVALLFLCYDVLSSRFYVRERRELRAGVGLSALSYPAGGVQFLEHNGITGPLYNQFEVGSYLLFFGDARARAFVHSNTFAYPAEFFGQAVRSQADPDLFRSLVDRYGINAVLLKHTYGRAHSLIGTLADSQEWELVFFDHNSAVFLRFGPRYRELMAAGTIGPEAVDLDELAATSARLDPHAPGLGMVFMGNLLSTLGWEKLAMDSYRLAVDREPALYEAWNQMGVLWGKRATSAAQAGDGWLQHQYNLKALKCFEQALAYKRSYRYARENLALARKNLGMRRD